MRRMRAISIRQPWAEEILKGDKKFEYRKTVCRILNEPVYDLIIKNKYTKAIEIGTSNGLSGYTRQKDNLC
jgi:hypothetical protein